MDIEACHGFLHWQVDRCENLLLRAGFIFLDSYLKFFSQNSLFRPDALAIWHKNDNQARNYSTTNELYDSSGTHCHLDAVGFVLVIRLLSGFGWLSVLVKDIFFCSKLLRNTLTSVRTLASACGNGWRTIDLWEVTQSSINSPTI